MQFDKKIVLSIIIIQTVSLLILMSLGHYQYKTILNLNINKKIEDTNYNVEKIIRDIRVECIDFAIDDVLPNKKIIEAFANNDREELQRLSLPIFQHLKTHNEYLSIMNFHTKDNSMFLRVQKPDVHSDNLEKLRPIVTKANSTQEMQSGIETGKYGIFYRVVFPINYKQKHIGVFELGIDIKYLLSKLSMPETKNPIFVIPNKSVQKIYEYDLDASRYLKPFSKEYSFIKYVSSQSDGVGTEELIDERIGDRDYYMRKHNEKEYLVFKSNPIMDYEQKEVGSIVFITDMDRYISTISSIRAISIGITLIIIIIIAILINKLIKTYTNKLSEQKDVLDYQAHYDYLTGLPNRTLFHDRLHQAIEKASREKSKFALLFIDLDRFKQINDSLGHKMGDNVLNIMAQRLQEIIRKEDTISRLGGDEFTVLLEDVKKIEDISKVAKKILTSIAKPIHIDSHTLYLSNSIGISIYPDDSTEANNLLKFADAAMYKAKEEGRNNFQYYSSDMTETALKRVVMEAKIRKAIENEEFLVYYQPQVNCKNDEIVGMEALVRWNHPADGIIYPNSFMHLAQETGLILAIDQQVMSSAMRQVAQWYAKGLNPGVLALNLSIKQLGQDACMERLSAMLKDSGCKPEWLELEVTEGEIMKNPQNAIDVLKRISNMGIELAVDDFGTGYSSLSYLKRLPIDKLKIDKSFIDGLPDNEEDASIARAVIALAKSLKLSVIAEGVETKEQRDFLVENGCNLIQGYFYSKPVPPEEMERLLDKQKHSLGNSI